MTEYAISEKGWVVIPAELRKKYGLTPGAKVMIVDYGGVLAIVPALDKPIEQATGMLKTDKKLTSYLLVDRRNED
jgi:AbrB family looped-hinge helix DNA binding protein